MPNSLDPIAAAKYGDLINYVYDMFTSDKTLTPKPDPRFEPEWTHIAWIDMSDFVLGFTDPKFYGVVLKNNLANSEFDFAIAIRGTEGPLEWFDDAMAIPVPFTPVPGSGRVAYGFNRIYSTLNVRHALTGARPSVEGLEAPQTFAEQIDALVLASKGQRLEADTSEPAGRFLVAGHSLGAALATLYVAENVTRKTVQVKTLCTFASPRVGYAEFVGTFDALKTQGLTSWRIANDDDIVTHVPPKIFGYRDVDDGYQFRGTQVAKFTVSCMHNMQTYQHYLDPASHAAPQGCALEAPVPMLDSIESARPAVPDSAVTASASGTDGRVQLKISIEIPSAATP